VTDEAFAAAWDDAVNQGTDVLEAEALRRAKDRFNEPRFYEGDVCGHVRKYSDTLLIFLLKARRPEKYQGRIATGSGPIAVPWLPPQVPAPLPVISAFLAGNLETRAVNSRPLETASPACRLLR